MGETDPRLTGSAAGVRLTQYSHGAGCACKLRAGDLTEVLARMPQVRDRRVLVGIATRDDAAVYRLDAKTAIVETVDFFMPVVDEPRAFGRIAAANALSDVWAMGGRPLFALNVVGFPRDKLPLAVLEEILAGGAEKCAEAGVPIVGGHSIDDAEPKYGLAVTGVVHPKKVLTNAGARQGDVLFLTKPIGTGIVTTALKRGLASAALVEKVTRQMEALNRAAGEALAKVGVNALTDVTGFGLLGHLVTMLRASGVGAVVRMVDVPVIPEAWELARAGVVPGGTRANLAHFGASAQFGGALGEDARLLFADAQTNGGLLAAVPARKAIQAERALARARVEVWPIGEIAPGNGVVEVV